MAIAYYVVVGLHIIACLFLIGVVLLQQGKNQDLASAFGGVRLHSVKLPSAFHVVYQPSSPSGMTTIISGIPMATSESIVAPSRPWVLQSASLPLAPCR